jgi:chaperonin cofactor prefoldin
MADTAATSSRFSLAARAFGRAMLLLLLIALIGGAIGAAIYYGSAAYYRDLVLPLRQNQARILAVETSQARNQSEIAAQLEDKQLRLNALEQQRSEDREALSELESDLAALSAAADDQAQRLDTLHELQDGLGSLQGRVDELDRAMALQNTRSAELLSTLQAYDPEMAKIQQEMTILLTMQYLERARHQLVLGNTGTAEMDLEQAYSILYVLYDEVEPENQDTIARWIRRLDLALGDLSGSPAAAIGDIDLTWQLMAASLSSAAAQEPVGTPTPRP